MATSTRFLITADDTGLWRPDQSDAAANMVTQLLQRDMQLHCAFFSATGKHNHIAHHLLSLYGTGAPPECLQAAYEFNSLYQLPADFWRPGGGLGTGGHGDLQQEWFESVGQGLLGRMEYYADFLRFFQSEIAADGDWRHVVFRYLLSGSRVADRLLARLFCGLLHPLIQLQYGIEWDQPAAVAQGLAQACVHDADGFDVFFIGTEHMAEVLRSADETEPFLDLYRAVAASPQLADAVSWDDADKMETVLNYGVEPLSHIGVRVYVPPTEEGVSERTAEMAETCVYVAAAAAAASAGMQPRKRVKFDFFLVHHITCLPFFLLLLDLDWVPTAVKARLLEWKVRLDLIQYAARACPPLDLDRSRERIHGYRGRPPSIAGPPNISAVVADAVAARPRDITPAAAVAAARLFGVADDDGHAIKLVRATGLAEQCLWDYDDAPWRLLRDPYLWEQIYRMEVDSVQGPSPPWVRTTGMKEAWKDIEDEI